MPRLPLVAGTSGHPPRAVRSQSVVRRRVPRIGNSKGPFRTANFADRALS